MGCWRMFGHLDSLLEEESRPESRIFQKKLWAPGIPRTLASHECLLSPENSRVIDQTTRAPHEQTVKQTKLLTGIIPFWIKWWLNVRVNARKTGTPRLQYFRVWTLDISVSSTITLGLQPGGRGREADSEWRYFRSRYSRVLRNRTQGNECVRDSVIHIFIEVDKNCFSLGSMIISWAG